MRAGRSWRELMVAGGMAAALIPLSLFVVHLESTRGRKHLEREGAAIFVAGDGSPRSAYLWDNLVTDVNLGYVAALDGIVSVELRRGRCSDEGLQSLQSVGSLGSLSICGTWCPQESLSGWPKLSQLRRLLLEDCSWVTDADLRGISRQSRLVKLVLTGTRMSDSGLQTICGLRNLRSLSLCGNANLTAEGLAVLAQLPQLEAVNLAGVPLRIEEIARLHEELPRVTIQASPVVHRDGLAMTDRGVTTIRSGIGDGSVHARFVRCEVDLRVVAELLSGLPQLRSLSLTDVALPQRQIALVETLAEQRGLQFSVRGRQSTADEELLATNR